MPRATLPDPLRVLLAILTCVNLAGAFWLIPDRGGDFTSFYTSALAWAAHGSPYALGPSLAPNLTPPWLLPVFWIFTRLPLAVASPLWTLLSVAAVLLALPTITRRTGWSALDLGLLAFGLTPGALTLGLGQIGFLLLLALTWAWNAQHERRSVRVGLWIGLLCAVKPFYGLFVLWFVYRRQWASVLSAAVVGVCAVLVSLTVAGLETCLAWIAAVRDIGWTAHLYNASLAGIGARVFAFTPDLAATHWTPLLLSPVLQQGTTIILGLVVLVVTVRAVRRDADPDRAFTILSLAGLLLSPLAWVHYLPVSLGPVLAVLLKRSRWAQGVLVTLALLPYQPIVNHEYGPLWTLLLGSWAVVLVAGIWAVSVAYTDRQMRNTAGTETILFSFPDGNTQRTPDLIYFSGSTIRFHVEEDDSWWECSQNGGPCVATEPFDTPVAFGNDRT